MKIDPVGAEFYRAYGWTEGQVERETSKLMVAFRNFAEVRKNL
jgi:hypothetical protein